MAKRVVLAVAGSGKTSTIIDQLNAESRTLIVTYTTNNYLNIKKKIEEKFNYFPKNIRLYTYFTFLHSFCYKPFLYFDLRTKGILYEPCQNRNARGIRRYISSSRRLYSNRIARLLQERNVLDNVVARLSEYFDLILFDEIQDFAGHDFNFLKSVVRADADTLFVGDYFQHTFDTSRDGNVNINLHSSLERYMSELGNMGLEIDIETLSNSYRCSSTICGFVTDNLEINIGSHREEGTDIQVVDDQGRADEIFQDDDIVKLFYNNSAKYECRSRNWGDCKGEDHYGSVCIVLNQTTQKKFDGKDLASLNPMTKNKFYVALTRTRDNLYLVSDQMYRKYKK